MLTRKVFKSPCLVGFILASFALLMVPKEGLAVTRMPDHSGALTGFIYASDMKTPVNKAVVKLRNVSSGKEFFSTPTDENGAYRLNELEEGNYVIGISAPDGDYNFGYMVRIKAGEVGKLNLALKKGEISPAGQESFGGTAEKPSFFYTPVGIAILMVATTVVLYGAFKLIEGKEEASPSKK